MVCTCVLIILAHIFNNIRRGVLWGWFLVFKPPSNYLLTENGVSNLSSLVVGYWIFKDKNHPYMIILVALLNIYLDTIIKAVHGALRLILHLINYFSHLHLINIKMSTFVCRIYAYLLFETQTSEIKCNVLLQRIIVVKC